MGIETVLAIENYGAKFVAVTPAAVGIETFVAGQPDGPLEPVAVTPAAVGIETWYFAGQPCTDHVAVTPAAVGIETTPGPHPRPRGRCSNPCSSGN